VREFTSSCPLAAMADNWDDELSADEAPEMDEEQGNEGQAEGAPSTGGARGKARAGGRGRASAGSGRHVKKEGKLKAKDAAKKGQQAGLCFAAECPEKKKCNSKWCASQHRGAESMLYQAGNANPPQTTAVQQVLADPGKARLASSPPRTVKVAFERNS